MKDKSRRFILSTTSTDSAYLYLPGMKGQRAANTLPLSDLIENYRGPDINVDLTLHHVSTLSVAQRWTKSKES